MGRLRLSHFFFYLNMFRKNYYMSYRSYYLYQKYQSINGSTPAPVYPMEYSYDGEGTMPTVVKSENDAACGYAPPSPPSPIDYSKEYLTIESLEDGNVIYWNNANSAITKTISASTDNGQTWTAYTSSTVGSGTTIATLNTGDKVLLKGINSTYASDIGRYNRFLSTKKYNVYGNIMSLLHGDSFVDKTLLQLSYTFQRLFHNTNVVDASNLILPATTLMTHCYWGMFWGCTNLTTAPELPATTLANQCYAAMFNGCTSLTTAPSVLPATTLTERCYEWMFEGCTSLTTAPELPATALAERCYGEMFYGCTSLTTAPVLPATTLATWCYYCMFGNCTSLTTAPVLPATTLANQCYYYMFYGCTSLTTVSELPATTLAYSCYESMFRDCTSLTKAPELPATTLANGCYNGMFEGCTSLTTVPELPATTLAYSCYGYMFAECTSLTTAPELPATTLASHCYETMFCGCTSLNSITCLATDISATNCTNAWVSHVAASGTFVKASSMYDWETGGSGIPTNWTVQNA